MWGVGASDGQCQQVVPDPRPSRGGDGGGAGREGGRGPDPAPAVLQYEMYTIERNAERTATAGRLLYDM